ncbi:DHA2 family efflux MFS transporter permease subunit [Rhodoblastus acidophilus]|uniref:DHA2 family efflux MFS transporter permease subunit n=1 Tax=Candidatus Rhodoblastus alkanivorans TaxID=2954117 RepID=A0ABS9Z137_9HYPH|nr:DHA2 family efflux MFS transporter permease subunit [Candidatus Rhodoblastus alkanivorans]MCI4678584.1 DHA2 family efflux MFS transporter permease subunit [Candidatus Rhodoblastus alkanivorans]MCI4681328.1 DHA2 family efflux MFS transporter permease subunit [Candidatus Rhodoblastus alkanivorans]MDI4642375.1 DHA2 family efflux MFS transporter permease subunit [Rhodoblastus acidophilus]
MSAAADSGADAAPALAPGGNPWVVAVVVALASFMEVLDTTIANVALRYIAGGLGVSADQASWVVTTYLVANAVIVTATAFFAKKFGRKSFFLACLGLFTTSSVACGMAWSLNSLLLFRVLQGIAGGGMVPVAQSILADSFPPAKRGQAFALFGIAVVVAPVIGPTLGGWLSDNLSWHWCFLINGPVGLVTMALIAATVKDRRLPQRDARFDPIGFLLVAGFLGALEVVLDRGQIEDWFGSNLIVTFTAISAISLLLLIPWEARHSHPVVDFKLLVSRQFGSSFVVMLAMGAILLATTQFMPELVQDDFGYTATWAGLALSPGGVVAMMMMFATGQLSRRVQPKYLIATGAAIVACSMYGLTNITPDLGFWFFAGWRMVLSLGLPLIFVPILAASYDGLRPDQIDMASALMNAARNSGGSIGVSLASNVLANASQAHTSRLVEQVVPSSIEYQQTLAKMTQYFVAHGSSLEQAKHQAFAWIGQQVHAQASLLAYIDVFRILTWLALSAIPLALLLRKVKLGGPAPVGH